MADKQGTSDPPLKGDDGDSNNSSDQKNGQKQAQNQNLMEIMAQIVASTKQQGSADPASSALVPKPVDQYKFWRTQPVPLFDENTPEGEIDSTHDLSSVPAEPQSLPAGFEWCRVDVNSDSDLKELYELLFENYVEDPDERFRFKYSARFLRWALQPPGWHPEWNLGIRASTSGKLLAFISGIPASLDVRGRVIEAAEINFLCVHKKLRSKRLAPVLIKEITRQCHLKDVWQALYTAGRMLPTPVATCRYFHRLLNWPKLYEVGFAYLPPGSTPAKQVARTHLPETVSLPGFRRMTSEDVDSVHALIDAYGKRFDLVQHLSRDEVAHWLLADSEVVHAYVVDDGKSNVTDFVSFYEVESTVLGETSHPSIKMAYAFHYATSVAPKSPELGPRLTKLFEAALIEAKRMEFDVFNSLSLMDAPLFLDNLNFSGGDGLLHYYLFNYTCRPIASGVNNEGELTEPGGVGVILL